MHPVANDACLYGAAACGSPRVRISKSSVYGRDIECFLLFEWVSRVWENGSVGWRVSGGGVFKSRSCYRSPCRLVFVVLLLPCFVLLSRAWIHVYVLNTNQHFLLVCFGKLEC